MEVNVYCDAHKSLWNEFVLKSKNGTFLFLRDYMDYHKDRFTDYSLLVFDDKKRPIALLPANKDQETLVSHGGLTYGGFVTNERMQTPMMLKVFDHSLSFLQEQGFRRMVYKSIPYIYHRLPSEEDSYALFRHGAVMHRRDVTSVVLPGSRVRFQGRRSRAVRKAEDTGVTCRPCGAYEQYWVVLEDNLRTAHKASPTHSASEIRLLHESFPENIRLFCAFLHDELIAGTVIYESSNVAHAQYTAASEIGRSCGALDLLFHYLLTQEYKEKKYFDFGISTESDGQHLNTGLIEFKEGFGGRSVTQDSYEIRLVDTENTHGEA